jgi:hypothetical protein
LVNQQDKDNQQQQLWGLFGRTFHPPLITYLTGFLGFFEECFLHGNWTGKSSVTIDGRYQWALSHHFSLLLPKVLS